MFIGMKGLTYKLYCTNIWNCFIKSFIKLKKQRFDYVQTIKSNSIYAGIYKRIIEQKMSKILIIQHMINSQL